MLYAGKNITQTGETLSKIPIDYLYNAIKHPKPELVAQIRQLRIVRDVDAKRYSACKRLLPYFVCAAFNPLVRRTEFFAYIEYFVVDIDHISQKGLSIEELRFKLTTDNRVLMLFASPGEDGLKLLFKLKDRCLDHRLYSVFYKRFVTDLSKQYNLEQVIDTRTSDVCRACFISHDPYVFLNNEAETVDINAYLDLDNALDMSQTLHEIQCEQKDKASNKKAEQASDLDQEAILKIKELLQLRKTKKEKNEVYVPEQLNDIIDDVKKHIEATGLCVSEIINIQYGKKIRVKLNTREAEINLFYGKRGFSVVKSPRCGTHAELNELVAELINNFLAQ